ncbi:MAG: hypothetical protein R2861_00865 [Desulfobacterales bacterium]
MSVDSDFGKGTTFHVFLPRSEGKYVPEKPTPPDMPSGTEQILLVDDEQDIVRSAARPWNTSDILSS